MKLRALLLTVTILMSLAAETTASEIGDTFQTSIGQYSQNNASQPAPNSGSYFLFSGLDMQNSGDFSAANFATPNGQPSNGTNGGVNPDMSLLFPTLFSYVSPFLTQSAYDAEFPNGVYTFTGTNSPNQSVTVDQKAMVFPTAIPYITDFAALDSLNPSLPFVLSWNTFTGGLGTCTGGFANCSLILLGISQAKPAAPDVFFGEFSPSTTFATIPANTFARNTTYNFGLAFETDQVTSYASGTAAFPPRLSFTYNTLGSFMVPEPSSLIMLGTGLLAALAIIGKKKRWMLSVEEAASDIK